MSGSCFRDFAERQLSLLHQLGKKRGVVNDDVVTAKRRILVAQTVQHMRVGRDDAFEIESRQHFDISLRQRLKRGLVAETARRVAGIALALPENGEVDLRQPSGS